jgi:hypothetical protein
MFYSLYLYQNAFQYFKMGLTSAMAWILSIINSATANEECAARAHPSARRTGTARRRTAWAQRIARARS